MEYNLLKLYILNNYIKLIANIVELAKHRHYLFVPTLPDIYIKSK